MLVTKSVIDLATMLADWLMHLQVHSVCGGRHVASQRVVGACSDFDQKLGEMTGQMQVSMVV